MPLAWWLPANLLQGGQREAESITISRNRRPSLKALPTQVPHGGCRVVGPWVVVNSWSKMASICYKVILYQWAMQMKKQGSSHRKQKPHLLHWLSGHWGAESRGAPLRWGFTAAARKSFCVWTLSLSHASAFVGDLPDDLGFARKEWWVQLASWWGQRQNFESFHSIAAGACFPQRCHCLAIAGVHVWWLRWGRVGKLETNGPVLCLSWDETGSGDARNRERKRGQLWPDATLRSSKGDILHHFTLCEELEGGKWWKSSWPQAHALTFYIFS